MERVLASLGSFSPGLGASGHGEIPVPLAAPFERRAQRLPPHATICQLFQQIIFLQKIQKALRWVGGRVGCSLGVGEDERKMLRTAPLSEGWCGEVNNNCASSERCAYRHRECVGTRCACRAAERARLARASSRERAACKPSKPARGCGYLCQSVAEHPRQRRRTRAWQHRADGYR